MTAREVTLPSVVIEYFEIVTVDVGEFAGQFFNTLGCLLKSSNILTTPAKFQLFLGFGLIVPELGATAQNYKH